MSKHEKFPQRKESTPLPESEVQSVPVSVSETPVETVHPIDKEFDSFAFSNPALQRVQEQGTAAETLRTLRTKVETFVKDGIAAIPRTDKPIKKTFRPPLTSFGDGVNNFEPEAVNRPTENEVLGESWKPKKSGLNFTSANSPEKDLKQASDNSDELLLTHEHAAAYQERFGKKKSESTSKPRTQSAESLKSAEVAALQAELIEKTAEVRGHEAGTKLARTFVDSEKGNAPRIQTSPEFFKKSSEKRLASLNAESAYFAALKTHDAKKKSVWSSLASGFVDTNKKISPETQKLKDEWQKARREEILFMRNSLDDRYEKRHTTEDGKRKASTRSRQDVMERYDRRYGKSITQNATIEAKKAEQQVRAEALGNREKNAVEKFAAWHKTLPPAVRIGTTYALMTGGAMLLTGGSAGLLPLALGGTAAFARWRAAVAKNGGKAWTTAASLASIGGVLGLAGRGAVYGIHLKRGTLKNAEAKLASQETYGLQNIVNEKMFDQMTEDWEKAISARSDVHRQMNLAGAGASIIGGLALGHALHDGFGGHGHDGSPTSHESIARTPPHPAEHASTHTAHHPAKVHHETVPDTKAPAPAEAVAPIQVAPGQGADALFTNLQSHLHTTNAHSPLIETLLKNNPHTLAHTLGFPENNSEGYMHTGDSLTMDHDKLLFHHGGRSFVLMEQVTDKSGHVSVQVHHDVADLKGKLFPHAGHPEHHPAHHAAHGEHQPKHDATEHAKGEQPHTDDSVAQADALNRAELQQPHTSPTDSAPVQPTEAPVIDHAADSIQPVPIHEAPPAPPEPVGPTARIETLMQSDVYKHFSNVNSLDAFTEPAMPPGGPSDHFRSDLFDTMRTSGIGPHQSEEVSAYMQRASEAIQKHANSGVSDFQSHVAIYSVGKNFVAHGGDIDARLTLAREYIRLHPEAHVIVENPDGGTKLLDMSKSALDGGYTPAFSDKLAAVTPSSLPLF